LWRADLPALPPAFERRFIALPRLGDDILAAPVIVPEVVSSQRSKFDHSISVRSHFRPIRPVLPAGSCLLRPESGPEAARRWFGSVSFATSRRLALGPFSLQLLI
jgi:hypothetical protein